MENFSIINKSKPGTRTCKPCSHEALTIMKQNENFINNGTELINSCRHQTKYLLQNWEETKP